MAVPFVDVIIPVYNEERILPESIATLHAFLQENLEVSYRILITDNASIDRTEEVGRRLAGEYAEVDYVRLPRKGRGGALRRVWLDSPARIVTYMDVDLSTNLSAFPRMIDMLRGDSDVVIGSRLSQDADTTRSFKREVLSRGYNVLVKAFFGTRFTDAQCGFKGVTREAAQVLLPQTVDHKWFFDTELLVVAEKAGYAIGEVPVDWIEDLDTRVQLVQTIWDDVVALVKLRGSLGRVLRVVRAERSRAQ